MIKRRIKKKYGQSDLVPKSIFSMRRFPNVIIPNSVKKNIK